MININSIDLVVRLVPRYGYLGLIIAHDRTNEQFANHEYYRTGDFKKTEVEALQAAKDMLQEIRSYTPPVDAFLKRQEAQAV